MFDIKRIKNWKYAGDVLGFAVCTVAGYLLSGTSVGGVSTFADISAAGAVSLPSAVAVFTGSFVHSIISGTVGKNIVKLSALALIVIIKMFLEPRSEPKLNGINTGISVFVSGAAVSAVIGELPYKLLFYLFYGGIAGFAAYSAAIVLYGLRKKRVADISGKGGFSCAVVYIVTIASLCAVKLPALDLGVIAGAAATLTASYFYGQTGGVLCGTLTVGGAFLSSSSAGTEIVLLPVAGLLAGFFNKQRPQTSAVLFTVIYFVMTVFTGLSVNSAESIMNIICAALIFIPVSGRFSDKWISTGTEPAAVFPDVINTRMSFLSDTFRELRCESERISDILADGSDNDREIAENSEAVCSMCYRRPFCWKSDRGNTYRGFSKLSEMCEFSRESFPSELSDCLHKDELLDAFNRSSHEKAAAKLMEMRFSESRSLLHEQMKITEELIRAAGERLDVRCSETVSRSIRAKLCKFGFEPTAVIAYYNARDRLLAEVYFSADNAPESSRRICDLIADELHLQLDCTEFVRSGNEVRIRVFEKPAYSMEVYAASSCAENESANGDTHTAFTDGAGIGYVVLSDGMGTGRNASAESHMVVGLFKRLTASGVNFESAIKLINSIMITKSSEESFATLDVLRIDLDECVLTVVKSGAAATLIRHRGGVMKITAPTFPIGIYERSEIFTRVCEFEAGDIVIMFSDGISENAYPFIKELLLGGDDIRHIVSEICSKAEVFNPTIHADDVTVIGVKVNK
ncbi:MAG: SpoIIE family protein phosphatase [Ruminococcus sp.]|uniref:SpoIIE family protein phosphatase n=1 Tax=Ruminococcus sp. TaxID=41978 RepID=UPI0025FEE135|nr:SpoIIE family protein phosphatase [Ruminococcus sp.]MCR5600922.1 SpoIIE family protein phosphatase [Ruminococcus sp.]